MGENKKLLPSQIAKINEKINDLENKIEELKNNNKGVSGSIYSAKDKATADVVDPELSRVIKEIEDEISELRTLVNEALVIDNYNDEYIEIGTRFEATINYLGETETEEYILIQSRIGYQDEKNAVLAMISSPFGSAVLGRTVGSEFEYKSNGQSIKGRINRIIPNEKVEEKGNQKTK